MNRVDYIVQLFETCGDAEYLAEPVSQKQQALQCVGLAHHDAVPAALIAAALLHDIGHLLTANETDQAGEDRMHEEIAAAWLRHCFEPAVTEPIRLHVIAKRYLCTIDPSYWEQLSQASVESLALQGGILSPDDTGAFQKNPYFEAALRVRRWDEAAKEPGVLISDLKSYIPMLLSAQRPNAGD